ncbi:MAG TPA: aminotransferase class V-fold PLP-dependent enzyme [Rhodothermales bacterium]|nr:aminotransferase class V-fold PLP-dependent enzyme [Rhodothermales bacterium]
MDDYKTYLDEVVEAVRRWEEEWGAYEIHPALDVEDGRFRETLARYAGRLRGNYPFFHPRYAGQMLKPPHLAAVAGYLAAMLINPNNHALDGGPPTGRMEKEVMACLTRMFRFPEHALGHLTTSGTIANQEALWVARELRPGKAVAFSKDAHYTHGRMSQVLGVPTEPIPTDGHGHMDLEALEAALKSGRIGTVVFTAGTTGLGTLDPVKDGIELVRQYDARAHVDAAYGGFFSILAWGDSDLLAPEVRRSLQAIASADSVVVDPHKHGLQPYGCGCVLFRDPSVGRFYRHDSPYTYFTSDELHLGEISLECSRAGAAAGALWLTLQLLPLEPETGLGPVLAACLRAARAWSGLLAGSQVLRSYNEPELDIVTFYPAVKDHRASALDAASARLFDRAMNDPDDPIFMSLYRVESGALAERAPGFVADQPHARILRSVLMKPEHEFAVPHLHERLSNLAREADTKSAPAT